MLYDNEARLLLARERVEFLASQAGSRPAPLGGRTRERGRPMRLPGRGTTRRSVDIEWLALVVGPRPSRRGASPGSGADSRSRATVHTTHVG